LSSYEDVRDFLAQHPIRMPDATPEPQPGQTWRAVWEDVVIDVHIVEAGDDLVLAMPVTPYSGTASQSAHYLGDDESPLGYAVELWHDLQRELPVQVLDGCYGYVEEPLSEVDLPAQSELKEAARVTDPRSELIDRLERELEQLAKATWMPHSQPIGPIRDLVRNAGLRLRDVKEHTSLQDEILLRINGSAWWLPANQIAELSDVLEVPRSDLPRSAPFFDTPELPRAINSPKRRAEFRNLSARKGLSEGEARLEAAHQILAAAARQSGRDVDERARWEHLLDVYLHDA
jgi:hypothetical protein